MGVIQFDSSLRAEDAWARQLRVVLFRFFKLYGRTAGWLARNDFESCRMRIIHWKISLFSKPFGRV